MNYYLVFPQFNNWSVHLFWCDKKLFLMAHLVQFKNIVLCRRHFILPILWRRKIISRNIIYALWNKWQIQNNFRNICSLKRKRNAEWISKAIRLSFLVFTFIAFHGTSGYFPRVSSSFFNWSLFSTAKLHCAAHRVSWGDRNHCKNRGLCGRMPHFLKQRLAWLHNSHNLLLLHSLQTVYEGEKEQQQLKKAHSSNHVWMNSREMNLKMNASGICIWQEKRVNGWKLYVNSKKNRASRLICAL